MTALRDSLARVVELSGKGTAGKWQDARDVSPNEATIMFPFGYVSCGGSRYGREANAALIAAAVNLIREHGEALVGMAELLGQANLPSHVEWLRDSANAHALQGKGGFATHNRRTADLLTALANIGGGK